MKNKFTILSLMLAFLCSNASANNDPLFTYSYTLIESFQFRITKESKEENDILADLMYQNFLKMKNKKISPQCKKELDNVDYSGYHMAYFFIFQKLVGYKLKKDSDIGVSPINYITTGGQDTEMYSVEALIDEKQKLDIYLLSNRIKNVYTVTLIKKEIVKSIYKKYLEETNKNKDELIESKYPEFLKENTHNQCLN